MQNRQVLPLTLQEDHLVVRVLCIIVGTVIVNDARDVPLHPSLTLVPLAEGVDAFTRIDLSVTRIGFAKIANRGRPGLCSHLTQVVKSAKIAKGSDLIRITYQLLKKI